MQFNPILWPVLFCCATALSGQSTVEQRRWNCGAELNAYALPDLFFLMPVMKADKGHLHLEARYNYEDLNTFSAWAGYNFTGGDRFTYAFTPMLGGVVGRTNGIAPGLEMTLEFGDFELYNESEYLFDLESSANNFFYSYTDFSYAPKDWFWFGISGQRTRLVDSGLEIERGFLLGFGLKSWEITGYVYNVFTEDTFGYVSLAYTFP